MSAIGVSRSSTPAMWSAMLSAAHSLDPLQNTGFSRLRSGLAYRRQTDLCSEGAETCARHMVAGILNNTDRAEVLGHHDLTPDGLPIGKSFAGQGQALWLRMDGDREPRTAGDARQSRRQPHRSCPRGSWRQKAVRLEVCDPSEDDGCAYSIDGIKVCNFVYPAYFQTFRAPGSTKFDHQGKLTAPIPALLPGGYISAFDMTDTTGWQHQAAATGDAGRPARASVSGRVSSRRDRRQKPRVFWRCSTAFQ